MELSEDSQSGYLTLKLVVEHSDVWLDQRQLCALLQSSKTVAAVVQGHLRHGLYADFRPTNIYQAKQIAAWIKRHAVTMRSIELHPCCSTYEANQAVGSAVAAALLQAGNQLKLRSFTCWREASCDALVTALAVTTSKHLTHLALDATEAYGLTLDSISLRHLSNLVCLELSNNRGEDVVLPDLVQVTALTELNLKGCWLPQHKLPASLVCWTCTCPFQDGYAHQLGHLTALTKLSLPLYSVVADDDLLPPKLLQLGGGGRLRQGALARLTSLQACDFALSLRPQQYVATSRRLTALTSFGILHDGDRWGPGTPLVDTLSACSTFLDKVHGFTLDHVIAGYGTHSIGLHHITQLSRLQWLTLENAELSGWEVCAALYSLSGLTRLELNDVTCCEIAVQQYIM